jgi:DNA excision repair protein ERCC-2
LRYPKGFFLKIKLNIAVRQLVEHTLRSGDLNFEFLGAGRMIDAIRVHQKVQKSRPEHYLAEVPVSHRLETDQFILTVSGRIDGVYEPSGPTTTERITIDEIKTTTRDLSHYDPYQDPLHWGQAKVYGFLYAHENSVNDLDIQLTYFQIDTGETRQFKHRFSIEALEDFFQDLVGRYLKWAYAVSQWHQIRNRSIRRLEFPFSDYRPAQRRMAVEVYRAIQSRGQLIIQAATGIGKTMAAIFPAIKAIPENSNAKVFYLTARTTGRTVVEKGLDLLRDRNMKLKSLTLTAKDKICFNPDSTCTADECDFARGYYDRVNDALGHIFQLDAFTRSRIEEVARLFRVCPFEFSLELSLWTDFIVCDYNYAFDPRVYLRRFFGEGNGEHIFLIDEAHNLVDRSRDMFSAEIRKQMFLDVRRELKRELSLIYKSLGRINTWLVKARKKCQEDGGFRSQETPPQGIYPLLRGFLKHTERWLSLNTKAPFREQLLDLYFTVGGFMRVAEAYDGSYATVFETFDNDLRVKLFCIDPSRQLGQALKRCNAAVFFSATMTPAAYFKNIFGCEESADHLILPSPFPPENLKIFLSVSASTLYRQRDRTALQITRTLISLVTSKKGNYFLFFPSYDYMLMIHKHFVSASPQTATILQKPQMAESEKDAFLAKFAQDNPETLVGFTVMGGIFGEGIDLMGERLCGAAIVGVGLPGISPERELIREFFTRTHGMGFEYAYQYPGINRVLQAAGRVIRSENDRGVVLLVGQRYSTVRYRSLLPNDWRPLTVQSERAFERELKQFWGL